MPAPEYVRVKQPETGHEFSMVASAAAAAGLTPLDKPATKSDGTPLPPKHHLPLGERSPGAKKPLPTKGREADTKAEKAEPEKEAQS